IVNKLINARLEVNFEVTEMLLRYPWLCCGHKNNTGKDTVWPIGIGTTMRGRDTNNATDIVVPLQSTGRDNDDVTTKLSDNWCAHITSVLVM
ncbi:hypothetical protein J6590_049417, partial [Homalodisca vitripennis]